MENSYEWRLFGKLYNIMDAWNIPDRQQESIANWILYGRPTGGFLMAVLENDLYEAAGRADRENIRLLPGYAAMLGTLPVQCWGSEQRVEAWRNVGGLRGIQEHKKEADDGTPADHGG